MRAKGLILLVASAALLTASVAGAADKTGKPLKPADPLASNPQADNWRERAMDARAEAPPKSAPRGSARAINERGDRGDGEEAGVSDLGRDRGEGGGKEE